MKKNLCKISAIILALGMLSGCGANSTDSNDNATEETTLSQEQIAYNAAKKAVLLVSYGTSNADEKTSAIDTIYQQIQSKYTDFGVFQAYMNEEAAQAVGVDTMQAALDKIASEGYTYVVCQPTSIVDDANYDEIASIADANADKFETIKCGAHLLGDGIDTLDVIDALNETVGEVAEDEAIVFVGTGAEGKDGIYLSLDQMLKGSADGKMFVGTINGSLTADACIEKVKALNVTKVRLYPLMITADENAEDAINTQWKTAFEDAGLAVTVEQTSLGEIPGIQEIFVQHVANANNEFLNPIE